MQLGMIGLGRMGANMATRLVQGGHDVVAFDRSAEAVAKAAEHGVRGVGSLDELVRALDAPRVVWMMVPAGAPVDETIAAVLPFLQRGDVLIDGGNSLYTDTMRRARGVEAGGAAYVDVGTSGGIWGLKEGYSLMIGGPQEATDRLRPIFETLAPAADRGWGRVGPTGAGHFVKMIHNGIEYGMMQAFAEGFAIMDAKKEMELDLAQVSAIWQHGSVVRSWLLDLIADALAKNPTLEGIAPYVMESGEGRWTLMTALELNVPAPVITDSVIARIRSRVEESYADKLLAIMRNQFGGHAIKAEGAG